MASEILHTYFESHALFSIHRRNFNVSKKDTRENQS